MRGFYLSESLNPLSLDDYGITDRYRTGSRFSAGEAELTRRRGMDVLEAERIHMGSIDGLLQSYLLCGFSFCVVWRVRSTRNECLIL